MKTVGVIVENMIFFLFSILACEMKVIFKAKHWPFLFIVRTKIMYGKNPLIILHKRVILFFILLLSLIFN